MKDATDDHGLFLQPFQPGKILSALEGERRNPKTKRNAIKAIERAASRLGSTATTFSTPPTGC